ncbi:hypothetical protein JB92DRAFT_3099470 [Gautieria morchelliformis]|nr:hypothetical protein JB92DRAFT_3099470 [Gautieria morchelliformis]
MLPLPLLPLVLIEHFEAARAAPPRLPSSPSLPKLPGLPSLPPTPDAAPPPTQAPQHTHAQSCSSTASPWAERDGVCTGTGMGDECGGGAGTSRRLGPPAAAAVDPDPDQLREEWRRLADCECCDWTEVNDGKDGESGKEPGPGPGDADAKWDGEPDA